MTDTLHPRILELVASRICHDLVSPVGAIANGVELMEDLGDDGAAEAMQLIAASARQASVRLKAFRLSYGAAGTDKNVGFKDIRDAFAELLHGGRATIDYEPDISVKFSMPPRGFFKVLLNVLVLAEECTRGEGKITVTAQDGNRGITVSVTGAAPAFREGAEEALAGTTAVDDLDPRSVHAYVTGLFARHFGLALAVTKSDGRIDFGLSFQ